MHSVKRNDGEFAVRPVFVNGAEGYRCYRIPGIVRIGNGDLLAVCEGRLENCGDHGGVIRVVAKISEDGGASWGPVREIARNVIADGSEHVAQNPSPIVDLHDPSHPQGVVVLLFNKTEFGERGIAAGEGVRRVYSVRSIDHGRTWVDERDITAEVHRPRNPGYTAVYLDAARRYDHSEDWRLNFPATGHGIQLRGGLAGRPATRGRLFTVGKLTVGNAPVPDGRDHVYWSDDHGGTWRIGGVGQVPGFDEAMAVELESGDVLVNFRNNTGPGHAGVTRRGSVVYSFDDNGEIDMSSPHVDVEELPDPVVQGTMHRLSWSDDPAAGAAVSRSRILFANPASTTERENITVRLSYDEGRTWPVARVVDAGPASYSDLVVTAGRRIGLLYERGNSGGIHFADFTLAWLTDGRDRFA